MIFGFLVVIILLILFIICEVILVKVWFFFIIFKLIFGLILKIFKIWFSILWCWVVIIIVDLNVFGFFFSVKMSGVIFIVFGFVLKIFIILILVNCEFFYKKIF